MVDGAALGNLKEFVSRASGPASHVGVAGRIVGEHLEDLPDGHAPESLPGLDDGNRAKKPHAVQSPVSGQGLNGVGGAHVKPKLLQGCAACQASSLSIWGAYKYLDSLLPPVEPCESSANSPQ